MQSLLLERRSLHGVKCKIYRQQRYSNILALHLIFTQLNKERAKLKYTNAQKVLPKKLIEEIQKYIQGETIYIPRQESEINKINKSTCFLLTPPNINAIYQFISHVIQIRILLPLYNLISVLNNENAPKAVFRDVIRASKKLFS